MRKRETKIIALVALIIGVAALTIGFAAFSRNLTIESSAGYTTSQTDLDVGFSTESSKLQVGTVNPKLTGAEATNLIISSDKTTISDISINFTAKGQKVEYDFFIYNDSDYTAYGKPKLMRPGQTENLGSTKPIHCQGPTETNSTLIKNACNDIKYTLTATDTSTVLVLATGAAKHNVDGIIYNSISIPAHTAIPVKLTIEYIAGSENVVPDGDFDILIGDETLVFSTQE